MSFNGIDYRQIDDMICARFYQYDLKSLQKETTKIKLYNSNLELLWSGSEAFYLENIAAASKMGPKIKSFEDLFKSENDKKMIKKYEKLWKNENLSIKEKDLKFKKMIKNFHFQQIFAIKKFFGIEIDPKILDFQEISEIKIFFSAEKLLIFLLKNSLKSKKIEKKLIFDLKTKKIILNFDGKNQNLIFENGLNCFKIRKNNEIKISGAELSNYFKDFSNYKILKISKNISENSDFFEKNNFFNNFSFGIFKTKNDKNLIISRKNGSKNLLIFHDPRIFLENQKNSENYAIFLMLKNEIYGLNSNFLILKSLNESFFKFNENTQKNLLKSGNLGQFVDFVPEFDEPEILKNAIYYFLGENLYSFNAKFDAEFDKMPIFYQNESEKADLFMKNEWNELESPEHIKELERMTLR